MSKKVLVTGCAGFIGYSITKDLLNNNFSVYGVDSLNDAYSEVLKKARLDNLLSNKSFTFNNIDLAEISQLDIITKFRDSCSCVTWKPVLRDLYFCFHNCLNYYKLIFLHSLSFQLCESKKCSIINLEIVFSNCQSWAF